MKRTAALLCSFLLFAACSNDDGGTATTGGTEAGTVPVATEASTTTTLPARPATIDELLALGRPLVLAHTAGEDEFPASTLFAFGESVKAGVDMLDLNVMLSKDGVLVVQHDDTVDGSTNGTGAVGDLTVAEITALDDAYWFTTECGVCHDRPDTEYLYRGIRTGEQPAPEGYTADDFAVPTFAQLVQRFPDLPLNIEIKGEGAPAIAAADELARVLVSLDRAEASVVTSFDDSVVTHFHGLLPDVELSPGLDASTAWVLGRTPLPDGMRILQLPPTFQKIEVITPQLVQDSTAAGYPIWIWPNNRSLENLASYTQYLEMGIAGLNINFPAQGVQAVQEYVADNTMGTATAASAGCSGTTAAPGETTLPFTAAGLEGTYVRHLPPAYDGTRPLPVVVDLHGWAEQAVVQVVFSGLGATGDQHGFITLTPDITRPVPLWDTALTGDDMQWLSGLLDEAESTLCVDTNRVFVAGMSNGAMMTSSVACALADRVAAVAPVAGVRDPQGCDAARAVPMVAFHGTADDFLAYEGGYGPGVADLPAPSGTGTIGTAVLAAGDEGTPVPDMVAAWAARNGCAATDPTVTAIADDVDLLAWDCPATGETVLYRVNDGGHTWPGSEMAASLPDTVGHTTMNVSANEVMWEFFRHHPLGA